MVKMIKKVVMTAKIHRRDVSLYEALTSQGFSAQLLKNAVVVNLKLADPETPDVFTIPDNLIRCSHLFLDAAERGGMDCSRQGKATIVCGSAGQTLFPYYTPKDSSYNFHAVFSHCAPIITITLTAAGEEADVVIEEYRIVRETKNKENFAQIVSRPIWSDQIQVHSMKWRCQKCNIALGHKPEGNHNSQNGRICSGQVQAIVELPPVLNRFDFATGAALEKSLCLNCDHVHYASKREHEEF